MKVAYPHCGMKRSCYLIVLFQSRTAPQNLRKPELADSTFEVANLALDGRRCLHPLRWFSANTTYHISMCKCLWRPVSSPLLHHGARQRLRDAGVQRRSSVWDYQILVVTADRSCCITRVRMEGEGRRHDNNSRVARGRGPARRLFVPYFLSSAVVRDGSCVVEV